MKVKIVKENREQYHNKPFSLIDILDDKLYDVISIEKGKYRIVDESGEDYLYNPKAFEIVEE